MLAQKKEKKVQFHQVKQKFNKAKKYTLNKSLIKSLNKSLNNIIFTDEQGSPNNKKKKSVGSILKAELLKNIEDKYLVIDNKIEFCRPKKMRSTNKITKVKFCDLVNTNKKKKGEKQYRENSPNLKIGKKNKTQNLGNITFSNIKCKTINKNISSKLNNNTNDKIKKSKSFNINNEEKLRMNTSKAKEKKVKKKKKENKDKEYKTVSEDTQDKEDSHNIIENVKHKCFCCL